MGQIRIIVDGPECIEPGCSNRTARRVHPKYNPIGQHRLRCDVCHDARQGKQEQRMDAFLDRQYRKEQADLQKGLAATRTAPHKDSQGNPQPWGKTTRARKYWQCEMCGDEIHPGEDYLLVTTYPFLSDYPRRTPVCAACSGRPLR